MTAAERHVVTLLRAEHLVRRVSDKAIVDDVSFALHAGEILGISGPSGSGKSSLLRLLNRLDEPASGTVLLNGEDYRDVAPRELRRRVALVMQRPYLFPGTVEDNLRFGPAQRGEQISSEKIADLLHHVGLSHFELRKVATLSGGEAQRVSLARALANSPSVLLLDEPTSALDDASKVGIETLIRSLVGQKDLGCVLVSHDGDQVRRLTDRALQLNSGRLVHDTPTC